MCVSVVVAAVIGSGSAVAKDEVKLLPYKSPVVAQLMAAHYGAELKKLEALEKPTAEQKAATVRCRTRMRAAHIAIVDADDPPKVTTRVELKKVLVQLDSQLMEARKRSLKAERDARHGEAMLEMIAGNVELRKKIVQHAEAEGEAIRLKFQIDDASAEDPVTAKEKLKKIGVRIAEERKRVTQEEAKHAELTKQVTRAKELLVHESGVSGQIEERRQVVLKALNAKKGEE